MLEKLTKKQEALMSEVAEEYIRDLVSPTEPDLTAIKPWLTVVYGLYEMQPPERIEIVGSPFAALKLASELTGESQKYTDDCGIGDGGWLSFYDYFHRIGIIKSNEVADVIALRNFSRCAWDSLLLDECAIVIRRPTALRLDDNGSLHAAGAPCIEWADGHKDYAWHGEWIPEKIAMDPLSHSASDYLAITNTEHRRALSEIGGWSWVRKLLGAQVADKWIDPETGLVYELLRCENGGPLLLSKQSPLLKGKTQPLYVEPVHEELRTARAARKWQATDLSVQQCEAAPELVYGIET